MVSFDLQPDGRGSRNRRTFLKSALTGGGIIALAGCAEEEPDDPDHEDSVNGEDGEPDDVEEIIWTTTSQGSAAYSGAQGKAAIINQNSDEVFMEARPSEGTAANIGRLDRGEADVAYTQNHTVAQVQQEQEPFDNTSFTMNQLWHFLDADWLWVTANEDWTSIADIEPNSRVSPTQRGSGTAPILVRQLEHAEEQGYIDGYDRISIDFAEQAGPFQENRLDVGVMPILNESIEGAYIQEQKSVVDLRVLEWPDEVVEAMEEDPLINTYQLDMAEFEGYDYVPDEATSMRLSYRYITPNETSYDAIYETLSTLYEHREELGDYHAIMGAHADVDHWVASTYEDIPYHPAAADFYEEVGAWQDDFIRGED